MKISLNQPNGFTSHFAPDKSKYLDSEGTRPLTQPKLSTKKENSTLMSTMKDQLLLSQVKIMLSLLVTPDSLKATTLSTETHPKYSLSLIKQ